MDNEPVLEFPLEEKQTAMAVTFSSMIAQAKARWADARNMLDEAQQLVEDAKSHIDGFLLSIVKMNGLDGTWQISQDGTKLMRVR